MAKYRKMLADLSLPPIDALFKLIPTQSKGTLCHWALAYSSQSLLPIWENHRPLDPRPRQALAAAEDWLAGTIKLPVAKPVILACHAAARESEGTPAAQAAARAIGQAASTIHACGHSVGIALYGALAVAYEALGPDAPWNTLEQRATAECDLILEALKAVAVKDEPNPCNVTWRC